MSRRGVLVGFAAERAVPCRFQPCRHEYRQDRAATMSPSLLCRRVFLQNDSVVRQLQRALHTATPQPRQRSPRAFRLTPPESPSTQQPPPVPSSSQSFSSPPAFNPSQSNRPLAEQFRSVMRLLTHPAVVLTAAHPAADPSADSDPSDPRPRNAAGDAGNRPPRRGPTARAMTMSSLTSLSLAPPRPVVTFNVAVPSRTFDAVAASGRFNVHVLAADAAGARVADWFAGASTSTPPASASAAASLVHSDAAAAAAGGGGGQGGRAIQDDDMFERLLHGAGGEGRVEVELGGHEAPVIKGDGVLYVLRCRLLEDGDVSGWVRVRDHVIVVGEVEEIVDGSSLGRDTEAGFGLVYADRRYRQLGNCITPAGRETEGL